MQDFAMPQALELESSRRNALPAVRREVVHNTTTQNEYRPQELCYIPLDTGAAGAFMDVGTTRLELTVVVQNKNYFVDFINLPRCGWHSLIQEFGIEINNGIHELNRHYAECVELEMIKMGQNRVPFLFTRPNPWRPADGTAGKFHINFIKPSMVTAQGLPHNVQYPSLTTLTSATTPDVISQSMLLFSNPYLSESIGVKSALPPTTAKSIEAKDAGWFVSSSFDLAQAYYDDRLISFPTRTVKATFNTSDVDALNTKTQYDPLANFSVSESSGWAVNHTNANRRLAGLPHGGTLLSRYSKLNPASTVFTRSSSATIYNVTVGQSVKGYPCSMWPAKQPTDFEKLQASFDESYRLSNADNIFNYYANCKNIPVGIPISLTGTDVDGSAQIWGDKLHTAPTTDTSLTVGAQTEFHICLKIYSSLIGELAKKWFPELVVPQGRMRVRIRWQEPQIVFQTLMDPCRRVPGTSRDWFPNLGVSTTETQSVSSLSNCHPESIMSGVHPIMVSNYIAGDVFIDAIPLGKYPIPMMRMKMVHDLFTHFDTRNLLGLNTSENGSKLGGGTNADDARFALTMFGTDLEESTIRGQGLANYITTRSTISGAEAMNALNQYHLEIKKNGEFGYPLYYSGTDPTQYPYTQPNPSQAHSSLPHTIAHYWNYTHPEDWHSRYLVQKTVDPSAIVPNPNPAAPRSTGYLLFTELDGSTAQEPLFKTDPNYDQNYKSLNWNPFCFPTPQYLPMANASDKRSIRILSTADFVNENEICFGTYKEAAVAQVRRTHTSLYPLQIPDSVSSRIDERLTYMIKNVQIVTQQIVLPRTAALSIIENALNGGISMETHAWKEMESMLPRQETQKALINMAAAFCTDISFVFRPIQTYQGDVAYGYNSFSFYNPFTSFHFAYDATLTPDSSSERDYNYLGGKPIYYNECIIQQRVGIDLQLQLSSELLPRQPIDTIRRLIQHIRWGDQVFSDRDYMQLNPHLHPSYGTQKGMVINTLQDGFWACFVPISALDDQTITCNPFFAPAEISTRKKLRGKRAPINALPFYRPFDGTFHISFNLETFMGQNEKIRTGVPVVNNNMFLKFDKAHLLRDYDTQLLTIAQCDARVVFERGGTMQFFT